MVDINPYEIIMQIVNFAILLWLLNKFLYKPLVGFLDKRADEIQSTIDNAMSLKDEAEAMSDQAKKGIEDARKEAKNISQTVLDQSQNDRQKMIKEAEQKVQIILDSGRKEVENSIRKAKQELKEQIADISVDIATKIIEKEMSPGDHERLIKDHILEISELK